jgi:hypothetical protein
MEELRKNLRALFPLLPKDTEYITVDKYLGIYHHQQKPTPGIGGWIERNVKGDAILDGEFLFYIGERPKNFKWEEAIVERPEVKYRGEVVSTTALKAELTNEYEETIKRG